MRMLIAFPLLVAVASATSVAAPADGRTPTDAEHVQRRAAPAIRVWLDRSRYDPGDLAVAHLAAKDDGYAVVFLVGADGESRIIFPASPSANASVRGGQEAMLGAAFDAGSFDVGPSTGSGIVFAAYSPTPFRLAAFASGGDWKPIAPGDPMLESDPVGTLAALVERASDGRMQFHVARYDVIGPTVFGVITLPWRSAYGPSPYWGACGPAYGAYAPLDIAYGYAEGDLNVGYEHGCGPFAAYTAGYCYNCGPQLPQAPMPPVDDVTPPSGGTAGARVPPVPPTTSAPAVDRTVESGSTPAPPRRTEPDPAPRLREPPPAPPAPTFAPPPPPHTPPPAPVRPPV